MALYGITVTTGTTAERWVEVPEEFNRAVQADVSLYAQGFRRPGMDVRIVELTRSGDVVGVVEFVN